MYKTITILIALAGLVACSSSPSDNPSDQSGQMGLPVAPPAGAAGTAAPPITTPAEQAGTAAPPVTPPVDNGSMTPPVTPPQAGGGAMPPVMEPPPTSGNPALALDECGLNTKWAGDEYCINAPAPDKGFQLRIGPSNYDNPEAQYVVAAGRELNEVIGATSGNTTDVYYYWRQYRMRPGSHHMILSKGGGIGGGGGRIGGAQTPAKDSPTGGVIAAENTGVGMQMAARSPLSFSLHYFNFTDAPIIKDVWVNVWYKPESEVTEPATEVFSMLSMATANITPGRHAVLAGTCTTSGTGRILTLYGHRHANNLRFSAWRVRGGSRELVFEDYNWEEPTVLEYSSVITNDPPNPASKVAGGFSGVLDITAGDKVDFECEVLNMTSRTFTGANEAVDDEMCILVGDSVGARVTPLCQMTVRDVN
jgi:hypothetical protein